MIIEFYIFRATDIIKYVTYQQTAQQISLIHTKWKQFQHSSPISYSCNQGAIINYMTTVPKPAYSPDLAPAISTCSLK